MLFCIDVYRLDHLKLPWYLRYQNILFLLLINLAKCYKADRKNDKLNDQNIYLNDQTIKASFK